MIYLVLVQLGRHGGLRLQSSTELAATAHHAHRHRHHRRLPTLHHQSGHAGHTWEASSAHCVESASGLLATPLLLLHDLVVRVDEVDRLNAHRAARDILLAGAATRDWLLHLGVVR